MHVFVLDIYHRITSTFYHEPYQSIMYGYAVDRGHLVDEYTAIREVSFRYGQLVFGILILILSIFLTINYLFILASIAVLFINSAPIKK
jgi:hypothetical protein